MATYERPQLLEYHPPKPREFNISPKTSHERLKQLNMRLSGWRPRIIQDIINNAKELDKEVNLDLVLRFIQLESGGLWNPKRGKEAMPILIAPTVASFARDLGCNIDSPPIVYISGSYFVHEAEKGIGMVKKDKKKWEDIVFGRESFNYDGTAGKLIKAQQDIVGLQLFAERMEDSIYQYAYCNLPSAQIYTEVVDALLFEQHKFITSSRRNKIVDLLRSGDIEEARAIILNLG